MENEDLRRLIDSAKSQKKQNRKLLSKLKSQKPQEIDRLFHEAHDEAFEKIDCLDCANCCKTTSPIFRDVDIERLSHALNMKPSNFIDTYLKLDTDGTYMLQSSPCPFLGEDNYCSVYEDRPKACREYPHTDRKNMHQILDLTLKNSLICPAVATIIESIRTSVTH